MRLDGCACDYCKGLAILDRLTQSEEHTITVNGETLTVVSQPGDSAEFIARAFKDQIERAGLAHEVEVQVDTPPPGENARAHVMIRSTPTIETARITIEVEP